MLSGFHVWALQGRKLLVIGTSSEVDILDSMSLSSAFNVHLEVPKLKPKDMRKVPFLHLAVGMSCILYIF